MIIEEINLTEKQRGGAEQLMNNLSVIELPKNFYFEFSGEPNFLVTLDYQTFWKGFVICSFAILGEEVIILVEDNKYFNKVKSLFENSNLKFRINY